jgi:hypothetical protein
MSDVSQGPGWWQASDGKWYSPEQAQNAPPPPAYAAAPAPIPKKPVYKRVWFWLLVIVVLGAGGCTAVLAAAGHAVDKANSAKHTVVYSVTGDGTADITYDSWTAGNAGTEQSTGQSLPWTKTIVASGLFNIYSVSASINTGSTATCTITVDGKVLARHTSTGQFANVSCDATAP